MKTAVFCVTLLLILLVAFIPGKTLAQSVTTSSAPAKKYDGIITQINMADGSFVLRLRDGNVVTVANPLVSGLFVSVQGVLDLLKGTLDQASDIKIKDPNGPDAIPLISSIYPGSGQVGTKITVTGTGFLKKKNSVSISGIKNVVTNLSSKDGTTLTFSLPVYPCNQITKTDCPTSPLSAGNYLIMISNTNGVSNPVPFAVIATPSLNFTTDSLPQVVSGTRYDATISGVGGVGKYSWKIIDGRLPSGLAYVPIACTEVPCNPTAAIIGVPTNSGTFQFTMGLTSGKEYITHQFSITVVQQLNTPSY